MLTYPISQGKLLNVVVAAFQHHKMGTEQTGPWVAEADNQELVDHFASWDSEARLIAQVRFTISTYPTLLTMRTS